MKLNDEAAEMAELFREIAEAYEVRDLAEASSEVLRKLWTFGFFLEFFGVFFCSCFFF